MLLQSSDFQLAGHGSLAWNSWSSRCLFCFVPLLVPVIQKYFRVESLSSSTFSAFIQQNAFVSSLFRIQTSRPSCGKTYFALSPSRLQNYRPPVGKQLFLLPFACLAVDQNKCHFAIKISVEVHIRAALRIDSRSNQK